MRRNRDAAGSAQSLTVTHDKNTYPAFAMTDQPPAGVRRHHFMGKSIDLPEHLTRPSSTAVRVRCGDERSDKVEG